MNTVMSSREMEFRELLLRHTILGNEYIPQRPTKPQAKFLLDTGREALYGGAAGGGKSSALLMAALQFVSVPGHSAIIFRRTYTDLALPGALMDRAAEWLSGTKAKWSSQEKSWTFPNGSTLFFGYLETENQKYRYASAEFQFIGFDELTQFEETQYRFLFSRLRRLKTCNVPLRMRAASNPGGIGHDWVKNRFLCSHKFYPAKITDNPHLDQEEYASNLMELDPITREQLMNGDWDAFEDGRFKREWLRLYSRRGTHYVIGDKLVLESELRGHFLTVDCAATVKKLDKDDPDYTVISAWATTPDNLLIWLGCLRLRCEIPDIPSHVAGMYARYGARKAYIEGGGLQKGVGQFARRHPSGMNVIEFVPQGDKLRNATDALCMAEAGRVWMPADDPAFPLEEVQAELLRFTGSGKEHDDIVDTLASAARFVMGAEPQRKTIKMGGVIAKGLIA